VPFALYRYQYGTGQQGVGRLIALTPGAVRWWIPLVMRCGCNAVACVCVLRVVAGRPQNDMENASYWDHLTSWWPHRDDPNVLLVFFEDLKTDLEGCVRRIAAFMDQGGVAAGAFGNSAASSAPATDEESIAEVVRLASFEYMSEHAHQFDEHLLKRARNPHMGLPPVTSIPPPSWL
jgi:hypothetical protein